MKLGNMFNVLISLFVVLFFLGFFYLLEEYQKNIKFEPFINPPKIIVLDPGHGGMDSGAISVDGQVKEKEINYAFSLLIKEELEKRDYLVFLTRKEDDTCKASYKEPVEDLACRVEVLKKKKGDIFISIHANSSPTRERGGMITYYNETVYEDGFSNPFPNESKQLATLIHKKTHAVFQTDDLGVQNAHFYVNRMAESPSVLLEIGFITNDEDLALIKNNTIQQKYAIALSDAVDSFFEK